MNSQDYSKKISKAYMMDFEEAYDKYVNLYNSKNSLLAFSELSNIYDGIIKIREIKKSDLKMKLNGLKSHFLNETIRSYKNGWSTSHEEVEAEINKLDTSEIEKYFNLLLDDFYELNDIDVLRKGVIEKLNVFGEFKENRVYSDSLDSALNIISELQKIIPNYHSLRFINLKILIEKYPEKIAEYSKLSGKEKQEITKAGRPLNKDLPQSDIEEFVSKKLFPNGEKTNDKKLIHSTGRREGKPNWNQLGLKYLEENPEIEQNGIMGLKQLKERIKKAYEVIITS